MATEEKIETRWNQRYIILDGLLNVKKTRLCQILGGQLFGVFSNIWRWFLATFSAFLELYRHHLAIKFQMCCQMTQFLLLRMPGPSFRRTKFVMLFDIQLALAAVYPVYI